MKDIPWWTRQQLLQKDSFEAGYFKDEVERTKVMLRDVLSGNEQYRRLPVIIAVSSHSWRLRLMRAILRRHMTYVERCSFKLRLIYKEALDWPRAELVVVQPGNEFKVEGPWIRDLDLINVA